MIEVGAVIAQGALPHGPMTLGRGPRTFAQAACLFCSLVMVARVMVGNVLFGVINAHKLVLDADGFAGSGLEVPVACKALGFKLAARGPFDLAVVERELAAGRPVVVGIDFVPGRSSGFSDADHFVTVVDVAAGAIVVADPGRGVIDKIRVAGPTYRGKPALLAEMLRFEALPV